MHVFFKPSCFHSLEFPLAMVQGIAFLWWDVYEWRPLPNARMSDMRRTSLRLGKGRTVPSLLGTAAGTYNKRLRVHSETLTNPYGDALVTFSWSMRNGVANQHRILFHLFLWWDKLELFFQHRRKGLTQVVTCLMGPTLRRPSVGPRG